MRNRVEQRILYVFSATSKHLRSPSLRIAAAPRTNPPGDASRLVEFRIGKPTRFAWPVIELPMCFWTRGTVTVHHENVCQHIWYGIYAAGGSGFWATIPQSRLIEAPTVCTRSIPNVEGHSSHMFWAPVIKIRVRTNHLRLFVFSFGFISVTDSVEKVRIE